MNNTVARGSGFNNSKSFGRLAASLVAASFMSFALAAPAFADEAPVSLGGVPSGSVQGPASGDYTNAKKPRWFFTVANGISASSVTCQVDSGAVVSSCLSPYQAPANLADGSHTFKITSDDGAGGTATLSIPFTVDTLAPSASIVSGPSGRTAPAVTFNFASNESGVTFRCRATGANTFAWRTCLASESLTGLVSGGTTVYVQATDRAGNQSYSASRTWTVVAEIPNTNVTSHPPVTTGSYPVGITRVDTGEFRFNSDDPLATFECRIDDEAWAACTSPYTFNHLVYGDHTFNVRAVNEVNTADTTPGTYSWTYAGEPDTSISSKPDAVAHSFDAEFGLASTYPDATFECKLDSGSWAACSSPKAYSSLALLGHSFQTRAVNQLGEPDLTPATYAWTVVDIPDTAITTAAPAPTFDSTLSPAFNSPYTGLVNGYPGATYQCRLDGGAWAACTSPRALSGLTPGSHTFDARALNSVNEPDESPASITWTVKEADTTITAKPAAAITARDASFSFTSDAPGATFQCKLDAAAWGACSGTRAYSDLALGSHTFQVKATKNGNTDSTPATYTFVVNTPDTTIGTKPTASTLDRTPTFSFTSDTAGVTYECKLDAGAWAACTSPKTYSSNLSVGSHTFQVRAGKFGASDVSPASYTWTVNAPDTAIGSTKPTAQTFDRTPSFSFSSPDLSTATFQCSLDGGAWAACTSPKTYSSNLSVGAHNFKVRAVNGTGAEDASPASYDWTVNAPDTAIGTTKPTVQTFDRTPSFSFSSPDLSSSTFQCSLDGGAWTECKSPTTYKSNLSVGAHNFKVRAVNDPGAEDASPASYDWTVNAPNTAISANPVATTPDRTPSFSFSSPDLSTSTFECSLDGGTWTACKSSKTYTTLAVGAHNFRVRAVNEPGAEDASPASYDWTITAPDTSLNSNPSASTSNRKASFTFSTTAPDATFECKLDGSAWVACTSPKAYNSALSLGDHTFQVRAVTGGDAPDASPASYTWTVVAPETSITSKPDSLTTDRTPSFGFASDTAGTTFECKLDGLSWTACTSIKNYTDLLDSGSHTFQVRALNGIDAPDASPATYTWTVQCPVIPNFEGTTSAAAIAAGLNAAVYIKSALGQQLVGKPYGIELKLTGTGTQEALLATFASKVKSVTVKVDSSTSRSLTAGNNWSSGFVPTAAGTKAVAITFNLKSGSTVTRTLNVPVDPACA